MANKPIYFFCSILIVFLGINNLFSLKNASNTEGIKYEKKDLRLKEKKKRIFTKPKNPNATTIDFNSQIKPILADRCFKCHGPDKNKVEAGLQLTSFEFATQVLKSGKKAIVPFKPHESELVKRILTKDPEDMMPTPKSNLSLTETEKKLLIKWIEEGAMYSEHWAFIPPKPYPIPQTPYKIWAKNDIDHFILKKLKETGLEPNAQATKETLIRRLFLDITGLPLKR